MNILGIETSSMVCSVGLTNEKGFTVERSLIDPHIHSEKLLTLVGEVLRRSELSFQSIDAIAVSIGPGSFTGLRIGLSTAKGLCYALELPLIAVPTFDSVARLAWDDKPESNRVTIALDAKQGEFYVASQGRLDKDKPLHPSVRAMSPEDMRGAVTGMSPGIWITDRTDVILGAGIPEANVFEYILFCGGKTVAGIGLEKFRKRDFADVFSIEPMYLKEFLVKSANT